MVAEVARTTLALAGEGDFELYCFGGNGANFARAGGRRSSA